MSTVIDAESYPADAPAVEPERERWYDRWLRPFRGHGPKVVVLAGIILFVAIFFAPDIFISIHSGEVGVLFLRFAGGTQTDRVLGEGMKVIPPWDKIFVYNARVQEQKHTMEVLTKEGLKVKVDLSIRYQPEIELVGLLHQQVGPDYAEKVVVPEVESALRTAMSGLLMQDVYSSQRAIVQQVINDSSDRISQKYIRLDEIVLREITLPEVVQKEVENKMAQAEVAESYQYRLEIARQEAARREIEANGLRTAQTILNQSLTPNILRWEGIEATRDFAKSPSTKTIIMGSRADGLPLILGDQTATPAAPAPPAAGARPK